MAIVPVAALSIQTKAPYWIDLTMPARALPPLETTFSLSSDSMDTPRQVSSSTSPESSPPASRFRLPRPAFLRKKSRPPPPPIRPPESEESDECYGTVMQILTEKNKEEIAQHLINPIAVIFREKADPEEAIKAFASLENKYFHPDTDDDRLFQFVIDRSQRAFPLITVYIMPENYIPQLCEELLEQRLSLIRGSPIIMRGRHIDTYDPSPLISKEFGLDICKRIYMVDGPFPVPQKNSRRRSAKLSTRLSV